MNTATIKEQLHKYLEVADDKKLHAIYTMVEGEIHDSSIEYTKALKTELDRRVEYYLKGGKMVSPDEMRKRLKTARRNRG